MILLIICTLFVIWPVLWLREARTGKIMGGKIIVKKPSSFPPMILPSIILPACLRKKNV